jgi:hypothetical protein
MPDCECLERCPYFRAELFQEISTIKELRIQKYCKGDNSRCARYMVFKALGKGKVPDDLIPTQVKRANEIINQMK